MTSIEMYGCVKAQSVWFSRNFPCERPCDVTGISKLTGSQQKCSISSEAFTCADEICCWLKISKENGGTDRYQNMVLLNRKYEKVLMNLSTTDLKEYANTLDLTKKMTTKINALRKQRELSEI